MTKIIRADGNHKDTEKLKPMVANVKAIHSSLRKKGAKDTFDLVAGLLLGMDSSRGDSNWQYVTSSFVSNSESSF